MKTGCSEDVVLLQQSVMLTFAPVCNGCPYAVIGLQQLNRMPRCIIVRMLFFMAVLLSLYASRLLFARQFAVQHLAL